MMMMMNDERVIEVHIVHCGLSTASTCTRRHSVGFTPSRYVVCAIDVIKVFYVFLFRSRFFTFFNVFLIFSTFF